jgi:hypothetical protein
VERPADLDAARAAAAAGGLVPTASAHLTAEVAADLPFESLAEFKKALKRFFSTAAWTEDDADRLDRLVRPHLQSAWWEHDLGAGLVLAHGVRDGRYELWVTGAATAPTPSPLDRVFTGPVRPEATPHPRKIKFDLGGTPAPGVWYRRGDQVDDGRVARLMEDTAISDVMVAGDFVTVGLERTARWEDRLDDVLDRVTDLFHDPAATESMDAERTRDELIAEGAAAREDTAALHLPDPDRPDHRARLESAAASGDARTRRVAVATLALSASPDYARTVVRAGFADDSRMVRRTAIDSAADRDDPGLRGLFEAALSDEDPWIRWKAVRALREVDVGPSRERVALLADDVDFRVRMEVAAALHG